MTCVQAKETSGINPVMFVLDKESHSTIHLKRRLKLKKHRLVEHSLSDASSAAGTSRQANFSFILLYTTELGVLRQNVA
jgi:hypothetical protein